MSANKYQLKIAGDAFNHAVKNRKPLQEALRLAMDVLCKDLIEKNAELQKRIEELERNNLILTRSVCQRPASENGSGVR